MKRRIVIFLGLILIGIAPVYAQEPVEWTYTAKALSSPHTYEVKLIATIQDGWHLYAQKQPDNAIAVPTSINFTKSPLLEFDGSPKEVGSMDSYIDPTLGIGANQYMHKVDFVQVVRLKGNAQANVTGTIQFQVCTDEQCLPPATTHFSIPLKA
jgi:hypothetical protein